MLSMENIPNRKHAKLDRIEAAGFIHKDLEVKLMVSSKSKSKTGLMIYKARPKPKQNFKFIKNINN